MAIGRWDAVGKQVLKALARPITSRFFVRVDERIAVVDARIQGLMDQVNQLRDHHAALDLKQNLLVEHLPRLVEALSTQHATARQQSREINKLRAEIVALEDLILLSEDGVVSPRV